MRVPARLAGEIRRSVRILLICFLAALGGIGAALLVSRAAGVPPSWLTRDPVDIMGKGAYLGLLSQIGIMVWAGTVAVCLWGASLVRRAGGEGRLFHFLLVSGFLTLALLLDDAFLLHERVLPKLHIPERSVVLGHGLILCAWFWWFRAQISASEVLLLGASILCLGVSAAIDQMVPYSATTAFLEDAPKFLGILLWSAYFLRTATAVLPARPGPEAGLSR